MGYIDSWLYLVFLFVAAWLAADLASLAVFITCASAYVSGIIIIFIAIGVDSPGIKAKSLKISLAILVLEVDRQQHRMLKKLMHLVLCSWLVLNEEPII